MREVNIEQGKDLVLHSIFSEIGLTSNNSMCNIELKPNHLMYHSLFQAHFHLHCLTPGPNDNIHLMDCTNISDEGDMQFYLNSKFL